MGSSRKHREKDKEKVKEKYVSRSRSKSKDKEKTEKSTNSSSHRSSHRYRDKESTSSSRKRTRDSSDDEKSTNEKKLKVKEVSKHSSINKSQKLDENIISDNDRTHRRDKHKEDDVKNDVSSSDKSLSIEETNKLRVKLGLKPLQIDESDGSKKDESGKDNTDIPKPKEIFVKTEKISDKLETQKIKERIETQREKRKIQQKLKKTKTLAQSDSEEEDTTSWVQRNRQIQLEKAMAAKRAKLLEEMDEEFGVSSLIDEEIKISKEKAYSSKDLKGLTVAHKADALKEGQQIVLTLKDKEILDEDEDVLENVNIVDDEKANKNIENKLKRPEYKPYDEPEFDEFGILKKNTLLSKYDEEIEGPKKDSFKLGISATDRANELELIRLKLKQEEGKISLVLPQPKIANEYYTHEEMAKFKKSKKIRKVLRKPKKELAANDIKPLPINDLSSDHGSRKDRSINQNEHSVSIPSQNTITLDTIDVYNSAFDETEILGPEEDLTAIVLEEDEAEKELQLALHKARKLKLRENVCATTGAASIVKVAQSVRSQSDIDNNGSNISDSNVFGQSISNNIILNSTAEFCRNLGDIPTYGMAGNRDEDEDLIEFERELNEEKNKLNDESEPNRGVWNEVDMKDEDNCDRFDDNEGQPILEEEPDVSVGLAGALKLAMKKGYLDKEIKKQASAQRRSLLEAQSYTIEEKFYEDDKVGRRERYNGPVSEFREKDSYRPEIKLDYVDEKGRVLDQKEAFRHLSHKFHGKGPGKNKIDKRMKKQDQESKLRQMSSTDTPLNTLKMLQEKQKELQSPFIVLTGGQKTGIQTTISKTK